MLRSVESTAYPVYEIMELSNYVIAGLSIDLNSALDNGCFPNSIMIKDTRKRRNRCNILRHGV